MEKLDHNSGKEINDNKCLHLTLLGRDDSVSRNELGEDTTGGFDTKSKGADINENHIGSHFGSREDATLDSCTISYSFVRIDALGRFLATKEFLEELLDFGNTSRTTDEDDLRERRQLNCDSL